MNISAVTALLLSAVLLTGCGDDALPVPIETMTVPPETTAITETTIISDTTVDATYDLNMRIGPYLTVSVTDQDAEAIVSEIRAQEEIPLSVSDLTAADYYQQVDRFMESYAVILILNDLFTDTDLGFTALELHDQNGWLFTNGSKYYKAPEEPMQRICKMQFAYAQEDLQYQEDEPFEDNGLILETCDVPEGSYFFMFLFQSAVNLINADSKLTDGSGNEIPMLIAGEMPDYYNENNLRQFDILTDTPLRQGKYTLTIGDVSADFSVIPAQDFVDAEKQRIQAEKEQKQAESNP